MDRRNRISNSRSIHFPKRLARLPINRQRFQAVHAVGPMLFVFRLFRARHRDFSGATTLMGTFKIRVECGLLSSTKACESRNMPLKQATDRPSRRKSKDERARER
jgi:hypothetical protein